jgi:outer membrane protein insertion porin family
MGLGRRVGEVWQLGLNGRAETVELDDIEPSAPVEVFEDAGPNNITSVGVTLTRSTLGRVIRPPRGSRLELSLEQVGALAGDFTFTAVGAEYTVFFTLAEDFLGRKSILKLNARTNYILQTNEAPVYEKYYLGGRSFRGFEFRTVSPKGVRADTGEVGDDPIGGEWLFFAGAEYEIPLIQETMTLVTFLDTGTVTEEPAVDEWRASIGAGMRLYIEQLGPVPLAFDFAYPFLKQDGDEEQVFSFGVQLPFN